MIAAGGRRPGFPRFNVLAGGPSSLALSFAGARQAVFDARSSRNAFELTTPGAILFARVFGVFTPPELNHLASEAEIAEASNPVSLDRITDLTAVERFEVGFREIFYFAIRRSAQRFSRVVKSAIIVQEPVQISIARIYEALNDNPQIQVRLLRSVTEATEWFADPTGAPNE